ncbi:unnamed protein product [Lota lota]
MRYSSFAVCSCKVSSGASSEAPTISFTTDLLVSCASPVTRNLHTHPFSTSTLPPGRHGRDRSMPAWSNVTLRLEDPLTRALGRYLDAWRRNASAAADALDKTLLEENFQDVEWYLVVMIGMFAFIVVAILVSTVKSKRREHSNDPYHKYIEGGWTEQDQQGYANANAS